MSNRTGAVRARGNRHSWTPQRESELVQRYQAGETMLVLARDFGMTDDAIRKRLRKLGKYETRVRTWREQDDEVLRREWPSGTRAASIAAILASETGMQCSEHAVRFRVRKLQIGDRARVDRKIKLDVNRLTPPCVDKVGSLEAMFDAAHVPASAVTFFEAKGHHCRWPYGDTSDLATFRYCGAPADGCGPYCAGHNRVAMRAAVLVEAAE